MNAKQAKLIAYGAAADIIMSSESDFLSEEFDDKDRSKIERQLIVIIQELNRRARRETTEFS